MSTEAALVTGMTALAGVVAMFWQIIHTQHKRALEELSACQKKHEESDLKIVEISSRLAYLEGHQEGLKSFAEKVLEAVLGNASPIIHDKK